MKLSSYPRLVQEWHPTKNGDLKPEDFTFGSNKKVWWKCPKGDDHEWQSIIASRTRGRNCPFCAGKKISKTNNLLETHPELASEWHPTKNGDLKPEDFTFGSNIKAWWKCPKGDDHEWKTIISTRRRGSGCPFCSGNKASDKNNLLLLNVELANEWHPTKNKDLKPENFTPGSQKKIWWKCLKNEEHEWQTTIVNRSHGSGCPFCSGKGTSDPEIRILCELKYFFGADEVEWRKKIDNVEIDIFISKYKLGIEFDGFHWHKDKKRSDGNKNDFFQNKGIHIIRMRERPLERLTKNDVIINQGSLTKDDLNNLIHKMKVFLNETLNSKYAEYIEHSSFLNETEFKRFISFLPSPPPEYSILTTHPEIAKQWHYEKNSPLKPENFTFGSQKKVWLKCPKHKDHEWEIGIARRCSLGRGCPFCSGHRISKTNSFQLLNPSIAIEWHPTKNGDLKPRDFTVGSQKKVWWKCPKHKDHEWQANIKNRTSGQGCPFCSGKKVNKSNSLLTMNPEIASEWHPTKNEQLAPNQVTLMSGKKVWWKCPQGEKHEWEAHINDRSRGRSSCPFCSGRKTLNFDLFK